MPLFGNSELKAAGFPSSVDELVFRALPHTIEGFNELPPKDVHEFDLVVTVARRPIGIFRDAKIAVGYLPRGPVTHGAQVINEGETRVFRKVPIKDAELAIAMSEPLTVTVRILPPNTPAPPAYEEKPGTSPAPKDDPVTAGVKEVGKGLGQVLGVGLVAFIAYQLLSRKVAR